MNRDPICMKNDMLKTFYSKQDLEATVAKYKVMQAAKIYRKVAVASPTTPQTRVTAAQAAELAKLLGLVIK